MREKFAYTLPFGLINNISPSKEARKDYDKFIQKCREEDIYPYTGKLKAAYRNLPPYPLGLSGFSPLQNKILLAINFAIQDTDEYRRYAHNEAQGNIGKRKTEPIDAANKFWPVTLNQIYDILYPRETKHRNREKMKEIRNVLLSLAMSTCVFSVSYKTQFQDGHNQFIPAFGNYSDSTRCQVKELNEFLKNIKEMKVSLQDENISSDREYSEYAHSGLAIAAPITLMPYPGDPSNKEYPRIRKSELWEGEKGDGLRSFYVLPNPFLFSCHQWRYAKGNVVQMIMEWKKENGFDSRKADEAFLKVFAYLAKRKTTNTGETDIITTSDYSTFVCETLQIVKDKKMARKQRYTLPLENAIKMLKGMGIIKECKMEDGHFIFERNLDFFRLSETCKEAQKHKQKNILTKAKDSIRKKIRNLHLKNKNHPTSWPKRDQEILDNLQKQLQKLPSG